MLPDQPADQPGRCGRIGLETTGGGPLGPCTPLHGAHKMPPMNQPASPITWRKPDGSVVSCFEKVKMLNENYAELRELLQDALDDALLLGCSEAQVRAAFQHLLNNLQASVTENPDAI